MIDNWGTTGTEKEKDDRHGESCEPATERQEETPLQRGSRERGKEGRKTNTGIPIEAAEKMASQEPE